MLNARTCVIALCLTFLVPALRADDQGGQLLTLKGAGCPAAQKPLGIAGKVKVKATIGTDGRMHDVKAVSGPDVLRQTAIALVSCEVHEPFIHNGNVVEVKTTVNVVFTKGEKTPNHEAVPAEEDKQQNAEEVKAAPSN